MGPFPGQQFKVQTMATNRSRPSLSVNFNIPFEELSRSMQVMHRAGFSVKSMNVGSAQVNSQQQDISSKKPNLGSKAKDSLSKSTNKSVDREGGESKSADKKPQRGRRQRRK